MKGRGSGSSRTGRGALSSVCSCPPVRGPQACILQGSRQATPVQPTSLVKKEAVRKSSRDSQVPNHPIPVLPWAHHLGSPGTRTLAGPSMALAHDTRV